MKQLKGSQTFRVAVLLALTGGFLDAYTYHIRGGVFANAQTGNIVKLGISLATLEWGKCLRYLLPIIAFVLGTLVALIIAYHFEKHQIHYIRRTVLAIEIIVLAITTFMPVNDTCNIIVNIMISFVCALQMEAFKTFVNQVMTTTVSTGNLRKMVEFGYKAYKNHNQEDLHNAFLFGVIVTVFISGAMLGTAVSSIEHLSTLIPIVLLIAALIRITIYNQSLKNA